jgi:hypothetical protein
MQPGECLTMDQLDERRRKVKDAEALRQLRPLLKTTCRQQLRMSDAAR